MIVLLLPTVDRKDWWVVTHKLLFDGTRPIDFRPIHALTLLAKYLEKRNRVGIFSLCLSLENKLFAVRHHLKDLLKSLSGVGDPLYTKRYVKEYGEQQKVICDLEAFISAIYASLEISAQINKKLHPELPMGFRKQSKKYDLFSFKKWEWLPYFFDLRSELVHFGSPLPLVSDGKFIIEFTQTKRLEILKKGKYEVPFSEMVNYSKYLFDMLDDWAVYELKNINPDEEIVCFYEDKVNMPLKTKKIKAKEILDIVDNYVKGNG